MFNNYINLKKMLLAFAVFFTISLNAQNCNAPGGLVNGGIGMHHARVYWSSAAAGYDWQITLNGNAQAVQSGTVPTGSLLITGLSVNTAYTVKVRTHCQDNTTSGWTELNFSTKNTISTAEGQLGTGADANPAFDGTYGPMLYPLTTARNGSVANMLYTQLEMQTTGIPVGANITGVAFEKLNGAYGGDNYPDLRMRLFAKNSMATAPLSMQTTYGEIMSGHTEVSDDPAFDLPATIGWINFPFETNFQYTGGAFEFATAMYQNGQTAQFSNFIVWHYTAGTQDYMIGAWPINTVPMDENLVLSHNSGGSQYKKRPNMKIFYEVSNAVTGINVMTQNNIAAQITQNQGTLQLVAPITPSTISQEKIWSIVSGVAFATISPSGLVTATGNGTVTVQAVTADNATITDTIEITITGQLAPVTAITVATANNVPAVITTDNGILQLTATVTPTNASQNVTWSIVSGTEFATVDANGLVTATNNGTVTVQAVSAENAAVADTIEITISNQIVAVAGIIVSVANNAEPAITTDNETLQLEAVITPVNSNQNIVWTIVSGSEFASVDANGLVTAINNGTVTVQAASAENDAIADTIEITISNQIVAVAGITVSVANDAEPVITTDNGTLQLEAVITPANSNQNVVWTIVSGSEFASVDANGLVTAINNGTVTVQAASAENASIADTIEITISNQIVAVSSLTIAVADDAEPVITSDEGTLQLVATILPSNSEQDVEWSIESGSENASVDANGLVTAIENGIVVVKAVSSENVTISDTIEITISGQVLGTDDFNRNDIVVYPNPAQTIVTIQSEDVNSVMVFSLTGQLLLQEKNNTINVAALAQGNYILKFEQKDGKQFSKRIIKE